MEDSEASPCVPNKLDTERILPMECEDTDSSSNRRSAVIVTPADSVVASDAEETTKENIACTLEATNKMCFYCFDVLIQNLLQRQSSRGSSGSHEGENSSGLFSSLLGSSNKKNSPMGSRSQLIEADNDVENTKLTNFESTLPDDDASCPLFVTWEKLRPQSHDTKRFELRGCIGTLAPRPLASSLGEYAMTSALRDRRFQPIRLSEVPELRVSVSLLINYEDCGSNVYDWVVGVHGIVIKFVRHGNTYSATYLPEVASDQRWSQKEAVASLVRKAGCHSEVTGDFISRSHMTCTRYQSSKCRISYQDYVNLRHLGKHPIPIEDVNSSGSNDKTGEHGTNINHNKFHWKKCFRLN